MDDCVTRRHRHWGQICNIDILEDRPRPRVQARPIPKGSAWAAKPRGKAKPEVWNRAWRRNVPDTARRRESRCTFQPGSEGRAPRRPRHQTAPEITPTRISGAGPGSKCQLYRSDPIARGRTDTRAWVPARASAMAEARSRMPKGSETTASSARRRPWRCRKDIAACRWRGA